LTFETVKIRFGDLR